jgi:glycosyltransferase involved in cell wall biosynthesis
MLIAIPSTGRPHHVAPMMDELPEAVWFVPADEVDAYAAAGADVRGLGSRAGASVARNAILDRAGDRTVAMVDDDIRWTRRVNVDMGVVDDVSLIDALREMYDRLQLSDMRLIGAAPTTNAYFTKRRTSLNLFARSTAWVVRPSALRLDQRLRVKEDYDFNLQHYREFGGWLRADDLLFSNQQRVAQGGCGPLRADGAEEEAVAYLLEKWPGLVRRHSTRANEITLTIPRRRAA